MRKQTLFPTGKSARVRMLRMGQFQPGKPPKLLNLRLRLHRRFLLALGTLALGGVAFGVVQSRFTDLPSQHWAEQAVQYAVEAGLLQGYPDQTFQGNKTLSRYEMAMVLYRLKQSGALQGNSQGQTMVNAGLEELKQEVAAIKATSDANNKTQAERLNTLEAQLKSLPAPTANDAASKAANTELEARLKTLEEQLAALPSDNSGTDSGLEDRLTALEEQVASLPAPNENTVPNAEFEARLKALENQAATPSSPAEPDAALVARLDELEQQLADLQALPAPEAGVAEERVVALEAQLKELTAKMTAQATPTTQAAPATTGVSEETLRLLEARVKALEDKPVAAAPTNAGVDTNKLEGLESKLAGLEQKLSALPSSDARVAPLEERVKKLEADLGVLSNEVNGLKIAKEPKPADTGPQTQPSPQTAPSPAPEVTPVSATPTSPTRNTPNLYFGAGASYGVLPQSGLGINAQLGFKRVLGPVGLRVAADYRLADRALALGADAIWALNPDGLFDPYIGLGAGGVFGIERSLYVGAVAGLNLNFGSSFAMFFEADPRYSPLQSNNFGVNLRAGLRFSL